MQRWKDNIGLSRLKFALNRRKKPASFNLKKILVIRSYQTSMLPFLPPRKLPSLRKPKVSQKRELS